MTKSRHIYDRPVADRFWEKVRKSDGCWEWTAGCSSGGYGYMSINRRQTRAHRFSWELHNGPVPEGMCVLHHCDNRKCVRPDHLFLGTILDNHTDMRNKGRGRYPIGMRNGQSKLSEDDIREIRRLASVMGQRKVAARWGIVQQHVSDIVTGRRWRHVQ